MSERALRAEPERQVNARKAHDAVGVREGQAPDVDIRLADGNRRIVARLGRETEWQPHGNPGTREDWRQRRVLAFGEVARAGLSQRGVRRREWRHLDAEPYGERLVLLWSGRGRERQRSLEEGQEARLVAIRRQMTRLSPCGPSHGQTDENQRTSQHRPNDVRGAATHARQQFVERAIRSSLSSPAPRR